MKLFDVHTHVQFAAFQDDYKDVIARALDRGVRMVNVGTQKDTSKRAIEIAKEYGEGVYASVGLHPIHTEVSFHDTEELGDGESAKAFTSRGEDFNYEEYKKLALDLKVVAIGECGLDYYRITNHETGIMKQKKIFEEQIKLSAELKKPLMIHCREAFADLIEILQASRFTFRGLCIFSPEQPKTQQSCWTWDFHFISAEWVLPRLDSPSNVEVRWVRKITRNLLNMFRWIGYYSKPTRLMLRLFLIAANATNPPT